MTHPITLWVVRTASGRVRLATTKRGAVESALVEIGRDRSDVLGRIYRAGLKLKPGEPVRVKVAMTRMEVVK